MRKKNPKGCFEPYKILILQDGQKVFKDSGNKEKVSKNVFDWFRVK
jgi:hypothetical protein